MPKGKSIYETYFDPGASTGRYAGSLQKVSDVWSDIDFSREKSAWETERRERNLDTLLATTELAATIGGSMVGFEEGSAAIAKKIGVDEPLEIGRGGKPWEEMGKFEKLWQSPRYQFGEDTIMSKSEIRRYGRDVKEFGKYGVNLPLDVYQGASMHEEYRQGYEKPEKPAGFVKKLGQTIVPGGETGYKDLYSGLGKKASDVVQTEEPEKVDPTDIHKDIREQHLAQFGGDRDKAMAFGESLKKHLGRNPSGWQEELDWIQKHGQDPSKWTKEKPKKAKKSHKLSFEPIPLQDLKSEQLREFMDVYHPKSLYRTSQDSMNVYGNWFKEYSK